MADKITIINSLTKTWATLSYTSLWRTMVAFSLFMFAANGYPNFEETNDPTNSDVFLQNMIVDGPDIYVGSVNRLYKLRSSDLTEVVAFDTGPVQDNRQCRPPSPGYVCDFDLSETDDVNKLLLLYNGELLTCSSAFQGTCQARDVNTLDINTRYYREVVSNYNHGRSVGFIAPGPYGQDLYTATPLGDWLRSGIPTMARRLLEEDPTFGDDPFDQTSEILIPLNTITEATNIGYVFNVSYVHGFSSGSHSYYVALQVEDYKDNGSPIRTKISRVCHQDDSDSFNSYIELPLKCSDGSVNYNVAQSAFVATVGSHLDDFRPGEDVLFVTFSKSTGLSSLEPTTKSAVCMYSVRAIDAMMADRRVECFGDESDTDNTQIEWLGNSPCSPDQSVVGVSSIG